MRPRRPNGCQVPWIAESSWRSVEWFSPPGHCLKKARKARGCAESGVGGIGWQYHSRPASASLTMSKSVPRPDCLNVWPDGKVDEAKERKSGSSHPGVGRRAPGIGQGRAARTWQIGKNGIRSGGDGLGSKSDARARSRSRDYSTGCLRCLILRH